jgi:hypothetical protein
MRFIQIQNHKQIKTVNNPKEKNGPNLQQIMGSLHVQPRKILADDLDNFVLPPSLVNTVHDPLRDPGLPDLQLLPRLNPNLPQPPQLLLTQTQLRQRRRTLLSPPLPLLPLHHLLHHHLPPQRVVPHYRRTRAWLRNRVPRRGPARIHCVPDPASRQPVGQRDEYFSGGVLIWAWAWAWAWALGVFGESEGAKLVGDALDGGFGQGLSVGGGAPDEELGGSR